MSRIAIVHPGTLLGKELRAALARRHGPGFELRLFSTDEEEIGTVTETGGTATFVDRFDPDLLAPFAVVFFCGEIERDRPLFTSLPPGPCAVVASPGATAADGRLAVGGFALAAAGAGPLVSPHAAVVGLLQLLRILAPLAPREVLATAIQPVSHYGEAGIEELFAETRGILTFAGRRRHALFGRQLAFNLMPAKADDGEEVDRQLAALLGGAEAPDCRLRLLQGNAFHGVALSVELRFTAAPTARELQRRLRADPLIEIARATNRPGPIDAAGSERILVGPVRTDAAGRTWLWAVFDNLTVGGALNAIALAEPYFGGSA